MKKMIVILTVFGVVLPLLAVEITFTATDNGDGTCTIGYYTDFSQTLVGPTCIGLNIDVNTGDDGIESVDGMDDFFNIFMAVAYEQDYWGESYDYGEPGVGSTIFHPDYLEMNRITRVWPYDISKTYYDGKHFAISQCGLGGESTAAVLEDSPISTDSENPIVVAVLHCSTDTAGTIGLNELVGGVVDKEGTMTTNLDHDATIDFVITQTPSAPDCWSYPGQCHGDTDGDGTVGLLDFYSLRDSWNKNYQADWNDGAGPYNPCADTNRDGVIGTTDFLAFNNYWDKTVPQDCSSGQQWPPVAP